MPVSMKSRSRGIPGPEEQSNVCIDSDVRMEVLQIVQYLSKCSLVIGMGDTSYQQEAHIYPNISPTL